MLNQDPVSVGASGIDAECKLQRYPAFPARHRPSNQGSGIGQHENEKVEIIVLFSGNQSFRQSHRGTGIVGVTVGSHIVGEFLVDGGTADHHFDFFP